MVLTTREPLAGFNVDNAMVSALRHDGDGVFIRIYNGTERAKQATVCVPENVDSYAFTDGLMNPEQRQKVSGTLPVTLPAFGVQGIKFFYDEK